MKIGARNAVQNKKEIGLKIYKLKKTTDKNVNFYVRNTF